MIQTPLPDCSGRLFLITGGAGMIGSTLARLAVEAGARVRILDAMIPGYGGNFANLAGIEDRVEFVYGDIRDPGVVARTVEDVDVVFNLAAQVSYVDSNLDPLFDLDINCRGHLTVLEACRERNPTARHVFTSSRFVYGSVEYNPVDETHPYNCLSVYGVHKLNAEKYYAFYSRAHGIPAVVFRIANPYGPRQQMRHGKYGILNWFVRLGMEGKPLTVFGDGAQVRDYVYVEDIARCLLLGGVREGLTYEVMNLGSGTGTPFRRMAEVVAEAIPGTEVRRVEWPAERVFVETGDYITDLGRVRELLDWSPSVSLEEGVARTVEYYRMHRETYWDDASVTASE